MLLNIIFFLFVIFSFDYNFDYIIYLNNFAQNITYIIL